MPATTRYFGDVFMPIWEWLLNRVGLKERARKAQLAREQRERESAGN